MNKIVKNAAEAIIGIEDGMTIMLGGFGLCGIPENILKEMADKKIRDLICISNNAGVDEAICINSQGYISEGVGENLFLIQKGIILTPPTSAGALRGITRGFVIQLAKELGYVVKEQNLTPTDLFTADEAFFTGTGVEIMPIVEINRRRIGNGKPSPITKILMNEFSKRCRDPKEGILIGEIAGS